MAQPSDLARSLAIKYTRSAPVKAAIVKTMMRIFRFVPWFAAPLLAALFAKLARVFKSRSYTTSKINIENCLPNYTKQQQVELIRKSLIADYQTFFESLILWQRYPAKLTKLLHFTNPELLKSAQSSEQGVVVNLLHCGNWELLFNLAEPLFTGHCIYRALRIEELDDYLTKKRSRGGWQFYHANKEGARALFDSIKPGQVTVVASDQEPIIKGGEFAPFFGLPALTATLLPKMVQAKQPQVLFATCLRTCDGFDVTFYAADEEVYNPSFDIALPAINRQLERIIMQQPDQFIWSYKRFKVRPEGQAALYD
jgi:Kdo2-lipid IVA lauroyltransferase/acyltransferase